MEHILVPETILLLGAGCAAGLLNGWLGLGGMSVFVPLLLALSASHGHFGDGANTLAWVIANGLGVSMLNGLISWTRYHRFKTVRYDCLPGSSLGAIIGAASSFAIAITLGVIAHSEKMFAAYLVLMGLFLPFLGRVRSLSYDPSFRTQVIVGAVGGSLAGLIGFNGNSVFTPMLRQIGLCQKSSIATAQVLGVMVSATAVLVFGLIFGWSIFDPRVLLMLALSSSVTTVLGASIKKRQHQLPLETCVATAYVMAGFVMFPALAWGIAAALVVGPLAMMVLSYNRHGEHEDGVEAFLTHREWLLRTMMIGRFGLAAWGVAAICNLVIHQTWLTSLSSTLLAATAMTVLYRTMYGTVATLDSHVIADPKRLI
jgi:uncharacterized membrane protein YfcA